MLSMMWRKTTTGALHKAEGIESRGDNFWGGLLKTATLKGSSSGINTRSGVYIQLDLRPAISTFQRTTVQ